MFNTIINMVPHQIKVHKIPAASEHLYPELVCEFYRIQPTSNGVLPLYLGSEHYQVIDNVLHLVYTSVS